MTANSPCLTTSFLYYQNELRHYLRKYVACCDTADDLLHDTFLRIAELEFEGDKANVRAFLYRIAGNLALDYLRREVRRQVWDTGPADLEWPCSYPQPDQILQGQQQWRAFHHWLTVLPHNNHQMFYAFRVDGKTQRQIAAEMRVSLSLVEKVLARTESSLKTHLFNTNHY